MVQPGVSALGKKKSTTFLPRKSFSDTSSPFSSGKVNSGALSLSFMAISPRRFTLYRSAGRAVIWVVMALGALAIAHAQFAKKAPQSKGPRALGLLQLSPDGKATLVPVSIMVDGKFYDAAAYKAAPVPMALESGTVYEAFRTGKSLGLFTVKEALTGNGKWLGSGTWLAAGATPPSAAHKAESKPRFEEDEGPPRLRKGSPKTAESDSGGNKQSEAKPSTPTATWEKSQSSTSAGAAASPTSTPTTATTVPGNAEPVPPEDADRPQLRRGAPPKNAKPSSKAAAATPAKSNSPGAPAPKTSSGAAGAKAAVQLIPAISDAAGPEARSYTYEMKPEEELTFRKKMLTLATEEIRKKAQETQAVGGDTSANRKRGNAGRLAEPNFQDVKLHVFDVSSNNEPVLVLTAKATLPEKPGALSSDDYITLVARSDLYGELRKLFSAVTDEGHLDVTPRMELIDAVDADGDGRGELLFRETSDVGSTYVIFRVGADQLWALYEGTASR